MQELFFDGYDFKAHFARGNRNRDNVALLGSDNRLADRRLIGNQPVERIAFIGADNVIGLLLL